MVQSLVLCRTELCKSRAMFTSIRCTSEIVLFLLSGDVLVEMSLTLIVEQLCRLRTKREPDLSHTVEQDRKH